MAVQPMMDKNTTTAMTYNAKHCTWLHQMHPRNYCTYDLTRGIPPIHIQCRRSCELRFLVIAYRLVKVKGCHDGICSTGMGFHVFNTTNPAPSIARVQEYETFCGGTFGCWMGSTSKPSGLVCRAIQRHELLQLFGLESDKIKDLLHATWEYILQRL